MDIRRIKIIFSFILVILVVFIFSLKINVYAQPLNANSSDYINFFMCNQNGQPCTINNVTQINPQSAKIALQLNGASTGSYGSYPNVGSVITFPYTGLTSIKSVEIIVPNIDNYIPKGYSIQSNEIDLAVDAGGCGTNVTATNFKSSKGFSPQPPSFSKTNCINSNPLNNYFYNLSSSYYFYNLPLSYQYSNGNGIFTYNGLITINTIPTNFNFTLSGSSFSKNPTPIPTQPPHQCSTGALSDCSPPPQPSSLQCTSSQLNVQGSLVAYGGIYSYRDLPSYCDLYYPAVSVTFNPNFLSVYHELFIKNLGNVIQYWIEPGI